MERIRRQITQHLMVALLALALTFLGFGHRMAAPDAIDLAAYALPDGTVPELCIAGPSGQGKADAPCPACTITAAMQLPEAVALPAFALTPSPVVWPVVSQPGAQAHHPRAPPARGPPAAFPIV